MHVRVHQTKCIGYYWQHLERRWIELWNVFVKRRFCDQWIFCVPKRSFKKVLNKQRVCKFLQSEVRLRDGGEHLAAGNKQKLRQTDEKSAALRAPIRLAERSRAVCRAAGAFDFMGRRIATRISVGHTSLRRSAPAASWPNEFHLYPLSLSHANCTPPDFYANERFVEICTNRCAICFRRHANLHSAAAKIMIFSYNMKLYLVRKLIKKLWMQWFYWTGINN